MIKTNFLFLKLHFKVLYSVNELWICFVMSHLDYSNVLYAGPLLKKLIVPSSPAPASQKQA